MARPVYVIDDDALVLDLVCGKLAKAGFAPSGYSDQAEFLEAAPKLAEGCVVLDLNMPGMDGLEVQRSLQELGCDFPVIFYTSKGQVRHAVEGMRAGAVDFVQKSPAIEPLLRALEQAFEGLDRRRKG